MTNEPQTGTPPSSVATNDSAYEEVREFLRSVEHRADAGVEERQEQIKALQREQKSLRAVQALARTLMTELGASRPGSALFAIERAKDARTYLKAERPAVDERIDALRA